MPFAIIMISQLFFCLSAAGQAQKHLKLAHQGPVFSCSLHPSSPPLPIFSEDHTSQYFGYSCYSTIYIQFFVISYWHLVPCFFPILHTVEQRHFKWMSAHFILQGEREHLPISLSHPCSLTYLQPLISFLWLTFLKALCPVLVRYNCVASLQQVNPVTP